MWVVKHNVNVNNKNFELKLEEKKKGYSIPFYIIQLICNAVSYYTITTSNMQGHA